MEHEVLWSPGTSLDSLEQQVILKAYKFYRQNKTATANSLGIAIRTLDHKLEKYQELETQNKDDYERRRQERERQLTRARGLPPCQYDTAATPTSERTERDLLRAQAEQRLRLESCQNASAQPAVPLQERPKVQEVLPDQAAGGRPRGRR